MNSAKFYEKVLNLPDVTDHFFIEGKTFAHCLLERVSDWSKENEPGVSVGLKQTSNFLEIQPYRE